MAINSKPNLQYYISYGFLSGSVTGRRFRRLMTKPGFTLATSMQQADIVIAHSAGCWELDNTDKAKLIILVGLPLAPPNAHTSRRTNLKRIERAVRNRHFGHLVGSYLANVLYVGRQPRRNLAIVRHAKTRQAQHRVPVDPELVFIANRHDPWPHALALEQHLAEQPWAFIGLPGSHDDIWEHPARYVAIIKYYARLLAATN